MIGPLQYIHPKYLSCVVLVVQSVSLVMLLRYTRTKESGDIFLNSTAVFLGEVVKTVACLYISWQDLPAGDFQTKYRALYKQVAGDGWAFLMMAVPSCLYAIQNNLLFIALSNLPAAVYQVTYQLKVLTTALFSVTMLDKKITAYKWLSLVILMFGVALVHTDGSHSAPKSSRPSSTSSSSSSSLPPAAATAAAIASAAASSAPTQSALLGFICVLLACLSSGYSGVFIERALKQSGTTIWVRNIQLGIFGMISAGIMALATDGATIMNKGFFVGYDSLVWCVVFNHALGGLVVAMVVKYADNLIKGFANSLSILICAVVSWLWFGAPITPQFCVGASLVLIAGFMYSQPDASPTARSSTEKVDAHEAIPLTQLTSSSSASSPSPVNAPASTTATQASAVITVAATPTHRPTPQTQHVPPQLHLQSLSTTNSAPARDLTHSA